MSAVDKPPVCGALLQQPEWTTARRALPWGSQREPSDPSRFNPLTFSAAELPSLTCINHTPLNVIEKKVFTETC